MHLTLFVFLLYKKVEVDGSSGHNDDDDVKMVETSTEGDANTR